MHHGRPLAWNIYNIYMLLGWDLKSIISIKIAPFYSGWFSSLSLFFMLKIYIHFYHEPTQYWVCCCAFALDSHDLFELDALLSYNISNWYCSLLFPLHITAVRCSCISSLLYYHAFIRCSFQMRFIAIFYRLNSFHIII